MELKRYVLMVDRQDGKTAKLAPMLKELGLRVMAVTSVPHAIDLVMKQQGLALVVISTDVGPLTSRALASTVRRQYPQLPVVWASTAIAPPDVAAGPYVTCGPTTELDQLRSQVQRVLRDGHYPSDMVDHLYQSVATVLQESYKITMLKHDAFLRFSHHLLADINSVIHISGPGVQGRVLVGCSSEWFQSLLGVEVRRVPDAEADVAGELCNRVTGRFKEYFEKRSVPVTQQSPTMVLGRGLDLREQETVSLALRCSLDAADTHVLFVDVALKGIFADVAKKIANGTVILDPGEVNFL